MSIIILRHEVSFKYYFKKKHLIRMCIKTFDQHCRTVTFVV